MDLDRMTVSMRPRVAWEAIDLGFAMARQWFLPLWLWWLCSALPLFCLAVLLFHETPWLVMLLIWWLKPLYEPTLLFWLSRALFDQPPSFPMILQRWQRIVWPQLLANLSWRRLSLNRSFYMPIGMLEGVKGKQRRSRISVLGRGQHAGIWLTLAGVFFELALEFSFLILIIIMLPEELQWLDLQALFISPGPLEEWLQHLADLLAMSLIAPFYVAGGFALYLTRRSELEAWDIELSFRRLIARRKSRPRQSATLLAAMAALICVVVIPGSSEVWADEIERERAKTVIEEVLADDTFGKKQTFTYWKYTGDRNQGDSESGLLDLVIDFVEGFLQGFAVVGEVLLWVVSGTGLAYLGYRILSNREILTRRRPGSGRRGEPPAVLFGLDVSPQNLPQDIGRQVRSRLETRDVRGALSLLYRGALAKLVHQEQLEVPDSATEGECLRLVTAERSAREADFFQRLTLLWVGLAYDHQLPDLNLVGGLCQEWESQWEREVQGVD